MTRSMNIDRCSQKKEECLNLNSEWTGSKIPGLRLSSPKGCISEKKDLEEIVPDNVLELLKRGCKRLDYWTGTGQEGRRQKGESTGETQEGRHRKKIIVTGEYRDGWENAK